MAQIAKIPPKPGQEEIYAKLQAWKAKLGLTAWMLLLTANRNAKGIASSKMKKGTINDMNNSLQTKGFTLLQLLVGIIIVNVIGSFVYGRWFAKSPSLKTQEPSNQVVQPAATNTSKKQHTQTIGAIQLSKDQRQEEAASEEVYVPDGVKVTVKRSRTIARTVNIQWEALGGMDVSVGIKDTVDTSVRGEIKRIKGENFQESETIEYKVELNGEKSNRYKLIWIDTWRKGSVELREESTEAESKIYFLPFEIREKTELHVNEIHLN
ncbi:hypothetical protein IQ223_18950 [Microcystis aeruginosa LEGE 00239]|uniref:hypothetical protein n=1 Tax=Microcystis aeruginosa TaxID=1126 RepID=UPI0018800CCC|nr:hypothetical protein [Microcystis aeruginosa LEGE 00239]